MKFFVSYRRKSWPFAHHMADELRRHTGGEVFIDYQGIDEPNFVASISRHLRESNVVLVVVSEHTFAPQIHRPDDWVRREIRMALEMRKPIVLVCVDGLTPPADLPPDIAEIASIQGVMFYPDYFEAAIKRLIGFISKFLPSRPTWQETTRLTRSHQTLQESLAYQEMLDEAIELLTIGNDDKAIFLLETLRDAGYKLPRQAISLERLIQYTKHEIALHRRVDLRTASIEGLLQFAYEKRDLAAQAAAAHRAYYAVVRLADDPAMLVQARKAWQAFQQQYPNFTDDTANLRERLRPDPDRSTPAKRFGGMMELIETIIPVRDQTTILRYNTEIPILEFCPIPSGYTRIGENLYWVEAFEIGKYPVTNAQFNAFIKAADGYSNPDWWNFSVEGRDWRRLHPHPHPSEFSGDKHPREMVCWYEAVAFTRWLSHRTGLPLSLPTEAQWQFAAQGDDNRLYPWGNTYDPSRCNTYESNILRTTPVDYYPSGVSRFGVFDMAGNVLEWCLNPYDNPALASLGGNYSRALRGGNWGYYASGARIAVRYSDGPTNLYSGVGFRVILRNSPR